MKYSQIRSMDVSNGEGIGVALFVQGCPHRCKNCFNPETWDFNGGKEWTDETEEGFLKLINKPYIKRISILGGEPLADKNLDGVLKLINKIRSKFPSKTIWLYSGYEYKYIFRGDPILISKEGYNNYKRRKIIELVDVFVDGRYIESQRDISLHWCGSSNQQVIDVQKSLEKGEIILWDTN